MATMANFSFTKSDCYTLCDIIEFILGDELMVQRFCADNAHTPAGVRKQLMRWYKAADRACAVNQHFAETAQEQDVLAARIIIKQD